MQDLRLASIYHLNLVSNIFKYKDIVGDPTLPRMRSVQSSQCGRGETTDETKWYLGIWFASIPTPTYVWVANRERPIKNPSLATLEITEDGKLVLKEDSRAIVWETNNLEKASDVKLLEQGNLGFSEKLGHSGFGTVFLGELSDSSLVA
ncbi:hypothetical protein RND71_039887 [Anisodus tanguticus]|uniref:Bulb-type lectin domain-containing protein n=1 Tax=Anisodus tanguticus TaxID=243964 RepID=A0AAE1QY12_9SOLA|nr:hypothetical protein RND71_039887 [Anisodus tanguticus]